MNKEMLQELARAHQQEKEEQKKEYKSTLADTTASTLMSGELNKGISIPGEVLYQSITKPVYDVAHFVQYQFADEQEKQQIAEEQYKQDIGYMLTQPNPYSPLPEKKYTTAGEVGSFIVPGMAEFKAFSLADKLALKVSEKLGDKFTKLGDKLISGKLEQSVLGSPVSKKIAVETGKNIAGSAGWGAMNIDFGRTTEGGDIEALSKEDVNKQYLINTGLGSLVTGGVQLAHGAFKGIKDKTVISKMKNKFKNKDLIKLDLGLKDKQTVSVMVKLAENDIAKRTKDRNVYFDTKDFKDVNEFMQSNKYGIWFNPETKSLAINSPKLGKIIGKVNDDGSIIVDNRVSKIHNNIYGLINRKNKTPVLTEPSKDEVANIFGSKEEGKPAYMETPEEYTEKQAIFDEVKNIGDKLFTVKEYENKLKELEKVTGKSKTDLLIQYKDKDKNYKSFDEFIYDLQDETVKKEPTSSKPTKEEVTTYDEETDKYSVMEEAPTTDISYEEAKKNLKTKFETNSKFKNNIIKQLKNKGYNEDEITKIIESSDPKEILSLRKEPSPKYVSGESKTETWFTGSEKETNTKIKIEKSNEKYKNYIFTKVKDGKNYSIVAHRVEPKESMFKELTIDKAKQKEEIKKDYMLESKGIDTKKEFQKLIKSKDNSTDLRTYIEESVNRVKEKTKTNKKDYEIENNLIKYLLMDDDKFNNVLKKAEKTKKEFIKTKKTKYGILKETTEIDDILNKSILEEAKKIRNKFSLSEKQKTALEYSTDISLYNVKDKIINSLKEATKENADLKKLEKKARYDIDKEFNKSINKINKKINKKN